MRRHVPAVGVPLGPLVAQEEVEHVLAEVLGDELALLHDVEGLGEVLREQLVAQRPALGVGQGPHVVLGGRGQLVALLDAGEAGAQDDRVGEVGVARGVQRADLHPPRRRLARRVHRDPDQRGAVRVKRGTGSARKRLDFSEESTTASASGTVDDTLEGMVFFTYGRGLIMKAPKNDSRRGTKYFHGGWWNTKAEGWFFRKESDTVQRLTDLGAKHLTSKKSSSSRS